MNIKNQVIKKSKIVATCGPSFESEESIRELVKLGVNVVRLNISHGDFEEHGNRIKIVKKLRKELNVPISILLDTKGPEIRIHKFKEGMIKVKMKQKLFIHTKEEILGDESNFSISYRDLPKIISKGTSILCDDGKLELEVVEIYPTGVIEVVSKNNHHISNNKGINVPGVKLTLPFIAKRDKEFIEWGIKMGINYIAASFVNDSGDVKEIKKIIEKNNGTNVKIMSKIESLQAVNNLNGIFKYSDAIMLARGDLGVEIPFYEVPFYEKLIINKCRVFGLPIVIATQMLDSMTNNPRPTRAEVTDIYFAISSGADATMLSGETANGSFPRDSVFSMKEIQIEAERNFNYMLAYEEAYASTPSYNAETAYIVSKLCITENIDYIIAFSKKGRLVKALSRFRTKKPIIAMIQDKELLNNFGVDYGVYATPIKSIDNYYDEKKMIKHLKELNIKGTLLFVNKSEYKKVIVE